MPKSQERMKVNQDGSLEGMLVKSKMGKHTLFRINFADAGKFNVKKYQVTLTPLE